MDDYLFMQGLLIERIKSAVPGLGTIGSLFKLEDIARQSAADPACWVIYCGDSAADDARGKNLVTQYWAAVLAVRRPEAKTVGQLLGRLIAALSDFTPDPSGVKPMTRAQENYPVSFEGDFLCFPLLFQAQFIWPRMKAWQMQP